MAKLVWQSEFIWQSDDGMVTGAEKECREYEERLNKNQAFSSFSSQDLVIWASAYKRIWMDFEMARYGKADPDNFKYDLDRAINSGKPDDLKDSRIENDYFLDLYIEACQEAFKKGNGCKPIDALKEQMLRTSRKKY
mgnify:CR=1 FL=1